MVDCGAVGWEGAAAAGVVESAAGELDGDGAGVLGALKGAGASVGGAGALYTVVVETGMLCSSTYTITSAASTVTTSTSVTTACLRWC